MPWTISSLKDRASAAFKANYWPCVGAALLASVSSGGCNFRFNLDKDDVSTLSSTFDFSSPVVWAVLAAILLVAVVFGILLRLLVLNPLNVGCKGFFADNHSAKAEFSFIAAPFRTGWKRAVKTMFLRDLYLFLWGLPAILAAAGGFGALVVFQAQAQEPLDPARLIALALPISCLGALLLVPVFVKTYSYRLVPYLLHASPDASGDDAITRSRALMDGHKFHAFLLDLSFLGWFILGIFTCGILFLFFVFPYKASADAALYLALSSPSSSASADPTLPPPLPAP